jgi:hypothetical protein
MSNGGLNISGQATRSSNIFAKSISGRPEVESASVRPHCRFVALGEIAALLQSSLEDVERQIYRRLTTGRISLQGVFECGRVFRK